MGLGVGMGMGKVRAITLWQTITQVQALGPGGVLQGTWEVATLHRPGDNGGRGQWLSEPPLCQELDSSGVGAAAGRQELGDPKASTLQLPGKSWASLALTLLLRSPFRALGNELSVETVGVASYRPKRLGVQPSNCAGEEKKPREEK